jgi:hydrogenase nickel incorporation protein HypB
MSAPGEGKTSLLERVRPLAGVARGGRRVDVRGSLDADRLADRRVPVSQLISDPGLRRECDRREMVRSGLASLELSGLDLVVIENVGNLVCLAEFRVGEDVRGGGVGRRTGRCSTRGPSAQATWR